MRKARHIPAVFFSLLIALPLLLIAGLQGWQAILKHQWKERLEQEAAQTITVPAASVVWEDRRKELVIDGKLFDVIACHFQDNLLIATGVFDEQETRLQNFLNSRYSHSRQTFSIVQLLFVLQCFAVFIASFFCWNRCRLQKLFSSYLTLYHNPFSGIVTPPPRFHFY